jgi:hypothetical protein
MAAAKVTRTGNSVTIIRYQLAHLAADDLLVA